MTFMAAKSIATCICDAAAESEESASVEFRRWFWLLVVGKHSVPLYLVYCSGKYFVAGCANASRRQSRSGRG